MFCDKQHALATHSASFPKDASPCALQPAVTAEDDEHGERTLYKMVGGKTCLGATKVAEFFWPKKQPAGAGQGTGSTPVAGKSTQHSQHTLWLAVSAPHATEVLPAGHHVARHIFHPAQHSFNPRCRACQCTTPSHWCIDKSSTDDTTASTSPCTIPPYRAVLLCPAGTMPATSPGIRSIQRATDSVKQQTTPTQPKKTPAGTTMAMSPQHSPVQGMQGASTPTGKAAHETFTIGKHKSAQDT